MRVLAMVHQPDAGPGVFADAIRSRGADLDTWMVPESWPNPGSVELPRHPIDYDAVLVFGGAMHVDQEDRHPWLRGEKQQLAALLERRVPLLAVCLGAQLLADAAGAVPRRANRPEIGWHDVAVNEEAAGDPLLGPLAPRFESFQWHSYEFPLPEGATPLARSNVCLQGYRIGDYAWGIQFHAEVSRADANAWIDDYHSDEDAVRIGLDPHALRERTNEAIETWNDVGRALCGRFLDVVATRA